MIGSGSYEDLAPGTVKISCNQNLRTKDQGLSSFYPSCISSLPCSNSVHGQFVTHCFKILLCTFSRLTIDVTLARASRGLYWVQEE